ncbi:MAG: hypothetical protein ACI4ME_12195 [Aristaeellaceae bacterium]
MKKPQDDLNLRSAFREEPERCHRALMDAARSVKEEDEPMRKHSMRTVLIAAVVALSMLTTAFAAGELLGWTDYLSRMFGIHISPQLHSAMQIDPQTYQVGPLTFTVNEAVSDNRMVMVSAKIAPTDGSMALLTQFEDDTIGAYGEERSGVLMQLLGVEDKRQPCCQVAAQKGIPMYAVRVAIEVDEAIGGGEGMEDLMWDGEGHVAYFSSSTLNPDTVGQEVPATLFLRVAQVDENGEVTEKWVTREPMTISVGQKLAEKNYVPETPYTYQGSQLMGIHAELYVTGAYLTCIWQMPEGAEEEVWQFVDMMNMTDGQGHAFENGISLSAACNVDNYPIVLVEDMINAEALPEIIQVSGVPYNSVDELPENLQVSSHPNENVDAMPNTLPTPEPLPV